MKNILFLILITVITSCGAKKVKISEQQKIDNLIDSLNYNVVLPENWNPILDSHKLLSYSPKNLGDIFYKNIIRINSKKLAENEKTSLRKLVENNLSTGRKLISIDSMNISSEKTKYGETYVYVSKSKWNFTTYTKAVMYFKHNDSFFIFRYSSDENYYEKYLPDVNFIFNNLTFKE